MASILKSLLGLSLLTILLPSVASINCFVCSSSPTNEQCNQNNQTCPPQLDTCMTIIEIFGNSVSIVKQCASDVICSGAMSAAAIGENGNGNIVNCCNGNSLCNLSGAGSMVLHKALPAVSLLLLLLLVVQ